MLGIRSFHTHFSDENGRFTHAIRLFMMIKICDSSLLFYLMMYLLLLFIFLLMLLAKPTSIPLGNLLFYELVVL